MRSRSAVLRSSVLSDVNIS